MVVLCSKLSLKGRKHSHTTFRYITVYTYYSIQMLSCKYYFRSPMYFILHLDDNIGAKAPLSSRE